MAHVLRYCHREKIPTFVLGKGSNVLFDDRGFNGCVILNRVEFIEPGQENLFRAGAGVGFNTLGILTARLGFTGLEFASGIPGTVGGAVFMNAGAHGCETGDVVDSVEIVTAEGTSRTLTRDNGELAWSYRTSPFQQMEGLAAIVAATFKLDKSGDARKRQLTFMDSRRQTQPITAKTAGCVFRNPGGGQPSAGALLDQLGLKGLSIGGAQVSEKHANFLVNTGSATCEDIRVLIDEVKKRVKEKTEVELHEEIRYVPHGYSSQQ
ncbi:UDP-N-acetylmuramate:NADP+ oxidoreductase [Klebsormidium nitens]|uniref:UDP-N-acetylmuramate dehydrogenase n=1 Tax=Klebsormidium nitens TaxID=105231 RepID=A0A1Y1HSJ4_KLENI|nr:UDP-N-acetylmuramate:NADP+ oxidoreductase [Klebsormidium nitens]|eukprot:GAQ81595.1 UDP-N-acetylmuramate:NADP+ oxidoreductase [Klebsormidium nitens]